MSSNFDCAAAHCTTWQFSSQDGSSWTNVSTNAPEAVRNIQVAIERIIRAQDAGTRSWWFGTDTDVVTLPGFDPNNAVDPSGAPSRPATNAAVLRFAADGVWGKATSLAVAALADSDGRTSVADAALADVAANQFRSRAVLEYALKLTCPARPGSCQIRFDEPVTLPPFGRAPGSGGGVVAPANAPVPVINAPVPATRGAAQNRAPTESVPGAGDSSAMDYAINPVVAAIKDVPWWGWLLAAAGAGAGGYALYRAARKGGRGGGRAKHGRSGARARPRSRRR